jgi:Tol biopolymer transport system component
VKRTHAFPLIVLLAAGCNRDRSQVSTLSAATVPPNGIGDSTVRVRRIEVDSGDFLPVAPSSDGRLMAGLSVKTGDVAVRDLRSGATRVLTKEADWETSYREAEAPLISPDGKLVAYAWQNDVPSFDYELRVIGTDGTGKRVLVKPQANTVETYPVDWTADARAILTLQYGNDNATRLALVNVVDGSTRVIRSFDWRSPTLAKISPDGSWIAYDFQTDERRGARQIILVRPSDGRESRITTDDAPKFLIGWATDGSGVFYRTTKGDAVSVWFVSVSDGKATAGARLVRGDLWGAEVLGIATGTLYYMASNVRQAIYRVPVDLDAKRVTAPPTSMVTGTFMRGPAVWSPDGRSIAFVRLVDARQFALAIRDVVSSDERTLLLPVQYGEITKWLADGKSVILRARQRNQWGSYRVDLTSGKTEFLSPLGGGDRTEFSPDGRTEYRSRNLAGRNPASPFDSSVVTVRDLASSSEREIYRGNQLATPRVSPNGAELALLRAVQGQPGQAGPPATVELLVVPTSGGAPRVVLSRAAGEIGPHGLNWTSDGKRIVFGGIATIDGGRSSHLTMVDVATGQSTTLLTQKAQVGGARLSPDERIVTFWTTLGGQARELWAMENLPGGARR